LPLYDQKNELDRAAWEIAVTKHVDATASEGLRRVCTQPYVSLTELETEAGKVGMCKEEVHSALRFLHATGSLLYYGTGTRQNNPLLQDTVSLNRQFMIDVNQFMIDAIKYVIREPNAENVNDELRAIDKSIRNQRDLKNYLKSGELTGSLLKELWTLANFNVQDHKTMLELMKSFKLLRPLGGVGNALRQRYVVPAMLPYTSLPAEYVLPWWWYPVKANDAAGVGDHPTSNMTAAMRVMYEVLGFRHFMKCCGFGCPSRS